jgi:glycosyltransferase involved in cell wall biosynthesis
VPHNKLIEYSDLPIPEKDIEAWPWYEESISLSDRMLDGSDWPLISIVTPSYNQGEFLEETIRSVLLQGYPNLEYIIIDGGSNDNSIEIIKKYEKNLTYWVSEKDRGQSHAINKGFKKATGEIYCWLNSDDYFLPDALRRFAQASITSKDSVAWAGVAVKIDKSGKETGTIQPRVDGDVEFFSDWWISSRIMQPACAFRGAEFNKIKGLNEKLHYAMDFDLWIKLRKQGRFSTIDENIACARFHSENKTISNTDMSDAEVVYVCLMHGMSRAAENRIRMLSKRNKDSHVRTISNINDDQRMSGYRPLRNFARRLILAPRRLINKYWVS